MGKPGPQSSTSTVSILKVYTSCWSLVVETNFNTSISSLYHRKVAKASKLEAITVYFLESTVIDPPSMTGREIMLRIGNELLMFLLYLSREMSSDSQSSSSLSLRLWFFLLRKLILGWKRHVNKAMYEVRTTLSYDGVIVHPMDVTHQ